MHVYHLNSGACRGSTFEPIQHHRPPCPPPAVLFSLVHYLSALDPRRLDEAATNPKLVDRKRRGGGVAGDMVSQNKVSPQLQRRNSAHSVEQRSAAPAFSSSVQQQRDLTADVTTMASGAATTVIPGSSHVLLVGLSPVSLEAISPSRFDICARRKGRSWCQAAAGCQGDQSTRQTACTHASYLGHRVGHHPHSCRQSVNEVLGGGVRGGGGARGL